MPTWMRTVAAASAVFALLVLGAALRPLVIPESPSAAPILTAVEVGFTQDMTAHHQQALLMVQRLDRAVDPAVTRLAEQLDRTQRLEIGTMLGWLRLAGAAPTAARPMAWMPTAHRHAGTVRHADASAANPAMPGMANAAELDALAAARGCEAEILFLQLMFRHHQGGIAMAEAADNLVRSGPVKEIARAMIHGQGQEAGVMGMLLTQRGAAPLP
ncbi:DUF305 domain-containing protein [Nocardia sp. NBC_00508]|uniref:DUF305 domain-containing protein n=1 Tax=Nocardia sp. NBC_00508 TaxID=2975992 RepID=UPI002E806BA3|nr:DUF305 domain-containing protein [Nocardia sp. NBC_00508]WUD66938.1 DUF305 domain-containing protein [Nocardia sp. NBC_00508]